MRKVIFETSLGILSLLVSCYVAFLYIKSLDQGGNLLLFGSLILLATVGIYFLIRAGKSDDTVIVKTNRNKSKLDNQSPLPTAGSGSIINRNNEIMAQWKKTVETRDRLKMLKLSASGNKE